MKTDQSTYGFTVIYSYFNSRKNQTSQKTNKFDKFLIDIILQSVKSFIDLQTNSKRKETTKQSN